MKAVIQRVSQASVTINNADKRSISRGLVILAGIEENDTEKDVQWISEKISCLRIFPNEQGKFDRSIMDIRGDLLVVSQFTLLGDCRKGRRPDFTRAAWPEHAIPLYEKLIECLNRTELNVQTGEFGADMLVEIDNDGPVTLILNSRE
jgi:D-tyrosyl-tRNA(Tyr) deacylase